MTRAQPFYCPYCGEQDFVPEGEAANRYRCESCARSYEVTFLGVVVGGPEAGGQG